MGRFTLIVLASAENIRSRIIMCRVCRYGDAAQLEHESNPLCAEVRVQLPSSAAEFRSVAQSKDQTGPSVPLERDTAERTMPLMCDLFCGRGGWTKGFLANGWDCIGIDLNPQPLYPATFIQADIAQLCELPEADFYCCSSPCEQFSVHCMKHFHKNPKWPWIGTALFEHARSLILATGKPYVMENVRCAERFIGRSVNHCGPFYLWGNGVPAVMPKELFNSKKNMKHINSQRSIIGRDAYNLLPRNISASAKFAEIPESISHYVAQCALNMITSVTQVLPLPCR